MRIQVKPQRDWNPVMNPGTKYLTHFIGKDGAVLSEVRGLSPEYRFKGDEQYVRASIIDSDGRRAWTQPAFRWSRDAADDAQIPGLQ